MKQLEKPKRNTNPRRATPVRHIRVTPEVLKTLQKLVAQANKKEFGKRVLAGDVVALALTLVKSSHIEQLKNSSLSNHDRFAQEHANYCKQHGLISRDEFLGLLMRRDQTTFSTPMRATNPTESDPVSLKK